MTLNARTFQFVFPRPAMLLGIVNVTPDSFSDGGAYWEPQAAVDHALRISDEGADIIDIGGESTRPGAEPVPEMDECRRVIPVIEKLSRKVKIPISIDTRKPEVARLALQAGASIVNDIQANRDDGAMWDVVAEAGAGYIAMHMQGTPQTMQLNPSYTDVVGEVAAFFQDRLDRVTKAGVPADRIILDVGIGFGKTLQHNLELLSALNVFTKLKRPLLLGASRKSFIGKLLESEGTERLTASIACACWAVECGVHIIRTHDVRETLTAVRMTEHILKNRK